MSSSIESLAMIVAQLQQTVFALGERERMLEQRVRELEEELEEWGDGRERARVARLSTPVTPKEPSFQPPRTSLDEHRAKERARIVAMLEETRWNRQEAAMRLGMPRRTLYRRMTEYDIQVGDMRSGVAKREKQIAKKRARTT